MITVKVTYTVDPIFVATNKKNIAAFLDDFRKLEGHFRYDVFLLADGMTFLHLSQYENESIQEQVLKVPSFLAFQRERDQSGLHDSHKVEVMTFIGSSSGAL